VSNTGLDGPTSGTVNFFDVQLESLAEDERAAARNRYVGFVFQNFQLIPTLTALENVIVRLELRGDTSAGSEAVSLLEKVSLTERASHYPAQLSGGEQQRVHSSTNLKSCLRTSQREISTPIPAGIMLRDNVQYDENRHLANIYQQTKKQQLFA